VCVHIIRPHKDGQIGTQITILGLMQSWGLIYKLRKMNIRNYFAILSHHCRMSANKLPYEKFTKELRKNYDVYKCL